MAQLRLVEIRRSDALTPHEPACADLARDAVEPNVFFEPWLLRSAWNHLNEDGLRVVLLYDDSGGNSRLCGLFPLKHVVGPLGLKIVELWQYRHCFLCAPLIREGWEAACWRRMIAWIRSRSANSWFWQLKTFPAEGRLWETLRTTLARMGRIWVAQSVHERAFLRWNTGATPALSSQRRKKLRRHVRELCGRGEFCFRELAREEDPEPWWRAFLELEKSGWKSGPGGTALGNSADTTAFFASACRAGHQCGRLRMMGAFLNGRPISMLCDFLTAGGSFYFKSAYDESFAEYSPGFLLEVESLRRLQRDPNIGWADSCHDPGATTSLKTLLSESRKLQNCLIASGKGLSDLLVSNWQTLRWGKHQFLRMREKISPSRVDSEEAT